MSKSDERHDSEQGPPQAAWSESIERRADTQKEIHVAEEELPTSDAGVSAITVDDSGLTIKDQQKPSFEQSNRAEAGGTVFAVQDGELHVYNSNSELDDARTLFMNSLRHRDQFVGSFLKQALRQSDTTFRLSVFFMTVGGLIVLAAAILAVTRFAGSPSHGIALVSGTGGILIGTSGAAFSLRADKARKHLASQASLMHSQLLDERRFTQVIDLLAGIKDPQLNDQARVSLAMRLMGEAVAGDEDRPRAPRSKRPGRRLPKPTD